MPVNKCCCGRPLPRPCCPSMDGGPDLTPAASIQATFSGIPATLFSALDGTCHKMSSFTSFMAEFGVDFDVKLLSGSTAGLNSAFCMVPAPFDPVADGNLTICDSDTVVTLGDPCKYLATVPDDQSPIRIGIYLSNDGSCSGALLCVLTINQVVAISRSYRFATDPVGTVRRWGTAVIRSDAIELVPGLFLSFTAFAPVTDLTTDLVCSALEHAEYSSTNNILQRSDSDAPHSGAQHSCGGTPGAEFSFGIYETTSSTPPGLTGAVTYVANGC